MMSDDLIDDEADELLAKIGVEIGLFGKLSEARDLAFLTRWVGRRKVLFSLVGPNGLGDPKAFRQDMDQRGVDVVDTRAETVERGIGGGCVLVHRAFR